VINFKREKNKSQKDPKPEINTFNRRNSQAIVRRSFTFAEAEQRRKIKNVEVGILGPGEISGLCEIIMDMPTYMQSTKCMEDCDVFFIYKRSYERLIAKRNPTCVNKMMEYVFLKLQARNKRLRLTNPIVFYRSLEYRLEILIHGRKKNFNLLNGSTNINSVALNGLKLPPRGPIIQMDSRPKAKIKAKKRLNMNVSQLTNHSVNIKVDMDESLNSTNSYEGDNTAEQQQTTSKEKKNCEKLFDHEFTSDQALNDLEDRIKQWHLQNGCKNPLLEAFHRIDAEVRINRRIFVNWRYNSQII
jgi:hypothetical protein